MKKRRFFLCLLLLSLLALPAFFAGSALGEGEYRVLKSGSYGNDVLALKQRLYALGYFSGNSFNNRFTDDTAVRVRDFEAACGLTPSGVATPALQALLFSEDAVRKSAAGGTVALPDLYASPYRSIDADASGDDVLTLKQRLKELGYFTAKAETSAYNDTLAEAIRAYQRDLGMPEDGVASPLLQAHLFNDTAALAALNGAEAPAVTTPAASATPAVTTPAAPGAVASGVTPPPATASALPQQTLSVRDSAYVSSPTAVPQKAADPTSTPRRPAQEVALPALNAGGFLADESAQPFVYADRDAGLWYYISQELSITIERLYTPKQNITWFETDIRCTLDSLPQAFLAQGSREPGRNFLGPQAIEEQYAPILAISDDFYGYRWYNKINQGVIIRNGEIKADDTYPANTKKWPSLEILAIFRDGSARVYESDEYTAQEYLDMGALHTLAFGPILVRDGVVDRSLYDSSVSRNTDREPRMAFGCVEPCHYVIVTAKGRTSDSKGVRLNWLAERMLALGCQNAINLDGGGTIALSFMGDIINKSASATSFRDISSMFGFAAP